MYKNGVIQNRGNQRVRERKIKENLMLRRPGNKDSSQMLAPCGGHCQMQETKNQERKRTHILGRLLVSGESVTMANPEMSKSK